MTSSAFIAVRFRSDVVTWPSSIDSFFGRPEPDLIVLGFIEGERESFLDSFRVPWAVVFILEETFPLLMS